MGNKINNWVATGNTFIQPFNFVGFGGNCFRSDPELTKGSLTGYLEYTLSNVTELIIPQFEKDLPNGTKSYKWNQIDGIYAIPGSSIRGMIRSAHEALTDSCIPTNKVEPLFKRRDPNAALKPGLLRLTDSGYELYDAKKYAVVNKRTNRKDKNANKDKYIFYGDLFPVGKGNANHGEQLYFSTKQAGFEEFRGGEVCQNRISKSKSVEFERSGYVCIANPLNRDDNEEHYAFLFEKTADKALSSRLSETSIQRLHEILGRYKENADGKNPYGYVCLDNIDEYYPIWYDEHGQFLVGEVLLSPASIGIELFNNSLQDILGSYKQCETEKQLCQTCQLFGIGLPESTGGMPGKVRFTDLLISSKVRPEITKLELSSPHLSSIINYAHFKQNPTDYLESYDDQDLVFNGRKFYWHHDCVKTGFNISNSIRTSQVEYLPKNCAFKGKVYFENISESQLGDLIATLELRKENGHKLGMGKPVGFGSVVINVDQIQIRQCTLNNGAIERSLTEVNKEQFKPSIDWNQPNVEDFMFITRLSAVDCSNINYPMAKSNKGGGVQEASLQWFEGIKSTSQQHNAMFPTIRSVRENLNKDFSQEELKMQ